MRQSVHEPEIVGHPQTRKTRTRQGVEHAPSATTTTATATTTGNGATATATTTGNDPDGAAAPPHAAAHVQQTNGPS